ncbi:MAG TPA: hypothetical protein VI819_02370 [Patescibacteria group bacterium]|nr:hypothetical protein [Patescibacteria group bacterium]
MYNHVLYLAFWLINFLLFYFAGKAFPNDFVFGTWKFTTVEAAIYSSFWLTVLVWTAWDIIMSRGIKYEAGTVTWIYFWVVNSLGIWLITRVANVLGFGISGWRWALYLGVLVVVGQKFVWNLVTRAQQARNNN